MHQDHGQSPQDLQGGDRQGLYQRDDGRLARRETARRSPSYDYNVEVTAQGRRNGAHDRRHGRKRELGVLGSLETMKGDKEDGHGAEGTMTREQLLTDPSRPPISCARRSCDALAIAIGTSARRVQVLQASPPATSSSIQRIKEIHQPHSQHPPGDARRRPAVPQELLAEIREFGGDMRETYGVPVEEIQEAIKHGVRKVNIDTDMRLAMTGAIRRFFAENPAKFDPRDYLKPAREAAKAICLKRYTEFGSRRAGQQDQGGAAAQDGPEVQVRRQAGASRSVRPRLSGTVNGAATRRHLRLFGFGPPPAQPFSRERRLAFIFAIFLPADDDQPCINAPVSGSNPCPCSARGKVRDKYAVGDDKLLIVATDRIVRFRRDPGRSDPRARARCSTADDRLLVRQAGAHRAPTTPPASRRRRWSRPTRWTR